MSSASTWPSRFSMTSSLSETLAPPRIATNGRSGIAQRLAEVLDLGRHQEAGRRLRDVVHDAFGGGVRAVRRSERVVHVDVGQRSASALANAGSFASSSGVEPQVLEQTITPPGWRAIDVGGRRRRCSRARTPPAGRAASLRWSATGFRLNSGFGLPFGRPRCDARITVAPCSSA